MIGCPLFCILLTNTMLYPLLDSMSSQMYALYTIINLANLITADNLDMQSSAMAHVSSTCNPNAAIP